jgi:hypothetical protein
MCNVGKYTQALFVMPVLQSWTTIIGRELITTTHVKGKAIPLQALTGSEGSRRMRLPDFKTIGT